MTFPFNANCGLIIVQTEVFGPLGNGNLSLASDTGATSTLIGRSRLVQLGYNPTPQFDRVRMITGSGVESIPRIHVDQIAALGQTRADFPVLCHTLPSRAGIDGLLGLDFLRGQELTVNFRAGRITLG